MKKFIILLVFAVPCFAMAQLNEDQLWENARYEVATNGAQIYYTDINVNSVNSDFSKEMLERIKATMFGKEGIVKVEFLHFNQTIRVYHFDYIELETVKSFVLQEREDIEVMNRVEFALH